MCRRKRASSARCQQASKITLCPHPSGSAITRSCPPPAPPQPSPPPTHAGETYLWLIRADPSMDETASLAPSSATSAACACPTNEHTTVATAKNSRTGTVAARDVRCDVTSMLRQCVARRGARTLLGRVEGHETRDDQDGHLLRFSNPGSLAIVPCGCQTFSRQCAHKCAHVRVLCIRTHHLALAHRSGVATLCFTVTGYGTARVRVRVQLRRQSFAHLRFTSQPASHSPG